METLFDESQKKMNDLKCKCSDSSRNPLTDTQELPLKEPIKNISELQKLENELKDKEVMSTYVHKMKFVCGDKGKSNGVTCAYKLIDIFFTRQFLTLCSWAGGSRSDQDKIAFKAFKNVILLFFQLIKLADINFTLEECETFFKNIIRNSVRRNACLNQRTSTVKNRPRKLNYKVKKNSNVEEENIIEEENSESSEIESNE